MAVTEVHAALTARYQPWFKPAMYALTAICWSVGNFSVRAAEWIGDKGCGFILRYGMTVNAE